MNKPTSLLQVKNVSKFFSGSAGYKIHSLEAIDFSTGIPETGGSILSILAPFGAGKSTLLKIISGIENPSEGEVLLDGRNIHSLGIRIPYISEKPSSFPWLNVKQNIEFGMNMNNETKEFKVQDLINLIGLKGYENHFPHNKSLGFRFRIALARALAQNPSIILIDDSFRAMDPDTRDEIQDLLINVLRELKITFLVATTNVVEAIYLSNQILLMSGKPGTIIKEIDVEPGNLIRKDLYRSEKFTYLKNQIETVFRDAKIIHTINFSV